MVSVSKNFSDPSGDLTLVSSDHVQFCVKREHLGASSEMFRDMLEVVHAKDDEDREIALEETAQTLEAILPYTQAAPVQAFALSFPASFPVIKALDKYGIWRGLDAVKLAFLKKQTQSTTKFEEDVYSFLFAEHAQDQYLRQLALKNMMGKPPTLAELDKIVSQQQGHFLAAESTALVHKFQKRRLQIREVFDAHFKTLTSSTRKHDYDCDNHERAFGWWVGPIPYLELDGLGAYGRTYVKADDCSLCEERDKRLDELLKALRAVPPAVV